MSKCSICDKEITGRDYGHYGGASGYWYSKCKECWQRNIKSIILYTIIWSLVVTGSAIFISLLICDKLKLVYVNC